MGGGEERGSVECSRLTAGLLPQLAVGCMAEEELQQRYCTRGAELEKNGKLRDAER